MLGSFIALAGAGMLAGGGALMIVHLTQRDDDGFLTSPTEQVSSDGYAATRPTCSGSWWASTAGSSA